MTSRTMVTYPDPQTLAEAVAARLLLAASDALARPGRQRFDIALTGGTDGGRVLAAVAGSPLLGVVDWSRVHLWWGDERFVAADSPDRNAVQARRALLDGLVASGRLPEANIHEMPADTRPADAVADAEPEENLRLVADAADAYQRELLEQLGERPGMDVALFGMGPDAHFASLFPGRDEVLVDDPHVLTAGVIDSPKPPPLRVTFTVPMVAASRRTWVVASGGRKAEALAKAAEEPRNPQAPVSYADAGDELLWLVDDAAASRL